MRLKDKTDVIKASPAIHIQNNVTLLQRRAWNVLLANAYDELPATDIHSVSVVELAEKLEFLSHNRDYLRETLEALVNCKVKWNMLDKDGEETWGVASLLASTEIRNGICTYGYSPHIRPQLYNPHIYAKINLRLQNKFGSKHALALWELCVDYFDESRNEGETPFIPLGIFRELMGLADKEYSQFKDLNKWVIKPAVKEINEVSDFHVEVEQKKKSRKVVALKFRVQKLEKVSAPSARQGTLFPDLDDLPNIAIELIRVSVSRPEALKIANQEWDYVSADRPEGMAFETYIQEKIHLLENTRGVDNRGGFLLSAIKENYPNPDFEVEQKARRLGLLEKEREKLKKEQSERYTEICAEIVNNEDVITSAIEELEKQGMASFTLERLSNYDSAIEGYRESPIISSGVNRILREKYPKRFKEVDEEFSPKIAVIDEEIAQAEC